jgi:hypothetical protein
LIGQSIEKETWSNEPRASPNTISRPPASSSVLLLGDNPFFFFLAGKQRDTKLSEFADQAKAKRKVEMLV